MAGAVWKCSSRCLPRQEAVQHGLEQIIGFLLGIERSVFADVYAEKVDKASKLQQSFFHG